MRRGVGSGPAASRIDGAEHPRHPQLPHREDVRAAPDRVDSTERSAGEACRFDLLRRPLSSSLASWRRTFGRRAMTATSPRLPATSASPAPRGHGWRRRADDPPNRTAPWRRRCHRRCRSRVNWLRRTIRFDRQLLTLAGQTPALGRTMTPSSVRTIPVPAASSRCSPATSSGTPRSLPSCCSSTTRATRTGATRSAKRVGASTSRPWSGTQARPKTTPDSPPLPRLRGRTRTSSLKPDSWAWSMTALASRLLLVCQRHASATAD